MKIFQKGDEQSFFSVLPEPKLSQEECSPQFARLDYSLRRYFVDEFNERKIRQLPPESTVLDIGGKKEKKRGQFDINKQSLRVKYLNIDPNSNPDYLSDASNIPIEDNMFDAIICSELLEHVYSPHKVLREASRILKPDGKIIITAPFLFPVHLDPIDMGRYTYQYWALALKEQEFTNINIERQGSFFCVLTDMIRGAVYEMIKRGKIKSTIIQKLLIRIIAYAKKKALRLDKKIALRNASYFLSYSTGYGIIAQNNISSRKD